MIVPDIDLEGIRCDLDHLIGLLKACEPQLRSNGFNVKDAETRLEKRYESLARSYREADTSGVGWLDASTDQAALEREMFLIVCRLLEPMIAERPSDPLSQEWLGLREAWGRQFAKPQPKAKARPRKLQPVA